MRREVKRFCRIGIGVCTLTSEIYFAMTFSNWLPCVGVLSMMAAAGAADSMVQVPDAALQNSVGLGLKANGERQRSATAAWKVFHGFQFQDRVAESGITFRQVPVDDGARDYKAVHYDHGTAIAAALLNICAGQIMKRRVLVTPIKLGA